DVSAIGEVGSVSRRFPLRIVTGPPVRLSMSPSSRIRSVVGAVGTLVTIRVSDEGTNGVADYPVMIKADEAVELSRFGSQNTDALGNVDLVVLNVLSPGQHRVRVTSLIDGEEQATELILDTSAGAPAMLQLHTIDGELVCEAFTPGQLDLCTLQGGAGEPWPRMQLSVRNGFDGVIAQAFGITLRTVGGAPPACDPLEALGSARFSEETGNLDLGPLALRYGNAAQDCMYSLQVGRLGFDLVLNQVAGGPSGGVFQRNQGTLEEPDWVDLEADASLAPIGSQGAPPAQQPPFHRTHQLRVVDPQDAFGNSLPSGRVMIPALDNAFVYPALPVLQDGEAFGDPKVLAFQVTGGPAIGAESRAVASSARGWTDPPAVRFVSQQSAPS
ncbi:MAG TPA: hypothetical protein DEB46_02910, partial [Myxococcales bacterium]|nr:hypothetical protein [Myxococcales bacterium]